MYVFQVFWGPELGPKFSPISNWEFSNILPNVDQKFPIVFKKKQLWTSCQNFQERLNRIMNNFKNSRKRGIVIN